MTADRWRKVEELFVQAVECPPSERPVLLDRLCQGDEELRRELESLVKESPQFTEAHVSLSMVYYRLKRPEDGKKEHDIVQKLTAEAQAKQPGAKAQ